MAASKQPALHDFRAAALYPSPSEASLKLQFLGQKIKDVQAPAAIVDAAVVRRNCRLMLETAEKLGVSFRAHVKTHKVRLSWSFGIVFVLTYPRQQKCQNCK